MRARLAWLGLLAACGPARLELVAPEGWASALVSTDVLGTIELVAASAPGPVLIEPGDEDVEVVAIFYRLPLSALWIPEGRLEQPSAAARSRPVPDSDLRPLARSIVGGTIGDTEELTSADPRVTRLRLPPLTDTDCRLDGRSLELRDGLSSCSPGRELPGRVTPDPPAPPATPRFLPCPAGWSANAEARCDPPPRPALLSCADGEAQRGDRCVRVGSPCPMGEFSTEIPSNRPVRFVSPSGRGPGGEPAYATIADALAGAPEDAVIAVSRGEHAAPSALDGPTILGACALGTTLRVTTPLSASRGALSDLTLSGATAEGFLLEATGTATTSLTGVIVEGLGLRAVGRLVGEDLLVRAVEGTAPTLVAEGRAELSLRGVRVEHAGGNLARVLGPDARASFEELVASTPARAPIVVAGGAALHLARSSLHGVIVRATDGAEATLEDAALYGNGIADANTGLAIIDASLDASRVVLDRDARQPINAVRSSLHLEDLRVFDGGKSGADPSVLIQASTVTLSRVALTGCYGQGLVVQGSRLSAADLFVGDALPTELGYAPSIVVALGTRAVIERVAVARASNRGLNVTAATATVSDLTVTELRESGAGLDARAFDAIVGARATLRRVRLSEIQGDGVVAFGDSVVDVEDLELIGASDATKTTARVIAIGDGATLDARRVRGARTSYVALNAKDSGRGRLSDVDIVAPCAQGVLAKGDCALELSRASFDGCAQGLVLDKSASLDAEAITIAGGVDGIDLQGGATLTARELFVTGVAGVGLRVRAGTPNNPLPPSVELDDSTIASSGTGVLVELAPTEVGRVRLEGLRLLDNRVDLTLP